MTHSDSRPNQDLSDELSALRAIVEGTAVHTGQEFFQSLVRHLAAAVGTRYAFVAEFAGGTRVRTLAFWFRDRITDNIEWDVIGTPCEDVVRGNLCHHPAGVSQRFPDDRLLVDWGIESYLGVPLCDARGRHLGHLAVFDDRPMPAEPRKLFTFRIFATRAAAELERLQFEERLRESEQRWRSLTEALPQLVWSATPDGACDYFSAQWTQHTGVPESDLLGWRWLAVLHPDDREPTRRLWTDAVAGRGPYDVEYRVRRSDGVYRWFKTRGVPIRDGAGKICKWFGTCTDITDLKRAEEEIGRLNEELRSRVDELQAILDIVPVGIGIALDPECRRITHNPYLSEVLGVQVWRNASLTAPPDERPDTYRVYRDGQELPPDQLPMQVAGTGVEVRDYEMDVVRSDGGTRKLLCYVRPLRDAAGRVRGSIGAFLDITSRRQMEEALRASEEQFRRAVLYAPFPILIHAEGGEILQVSQTWTELTGYTQEELRTISDWTGRAYGERKVLVESDIERLYHLDARVEQGEYVVTTRGGETRIWDFHSAPLGRLPDGRRRVISMAVDVTERKRAEAELRESEERFRGTFENAAVGIAHRDATGRFLRVNEKFCAIVGYSREELLQKNIRGITHPNDLAATIDAFTALWQGESPTLGLEKRYVHNDGSLVWIDLFASLQRDAAGKPAYDISIVNDISERKQLEEELRASEERRRLILDNANDAFVAMSADGLIAEWNHQAEITFGWPGAEAVGRVLSETIIPPQFREAHIGGVARFLATGEGPLLNRVVEVRALRRDGSEFPAEISIAPVRMGEHYLFVAFIRDVTERKRAEEELRRAKEAAEAANRAKDEFLANVSHEIRTPMNAILGMTELALDTPLTDDQRQFLRTVKSAADNLLGIINDLLDFAKIEAGKLELNCADFSLRTVVGDTLRALAVRAHSKGLELIYDVQPEVPDALVADAGRLRQVLLNLVGNAIKFTDEGEVVVRVEAAGGPAPEGEVALRFTVRDTGIGIPPDKQEAIFRAFEQEDTSTTRKYGGTGLGLTIASQLVALMGGEIRVDSAPGRGSTFGFTGRFGLQPHPTEPTAVPPPAVLRKLPVLIVDDNATNRHILQEWLRAWQMEAEAVGDAASAMDALWHRAANGRPYALVLLDARMPDRDGLTVAALIRERAELSATRLILLTSGDRPGDLARLRELRIDAQLLKPVPQEELLETIYRVMNRPPGHGPTTVRSAPAQVLAAVPDPAAPPLHVLVAEDNEFSARLLDQLLGRRGHRVRLASNGPEALALVQEGGFDVLLLDIHMPGLDGFRVVGVIRERERAGGHLPVIALTARSRKEDRERCLAAGMDDFLTKPVSAAALFAAIDRLVSAHGVSRPEQADTGERGSLLDPVAVLTACGDDAEGLRSMCQDFQAHASAQLAEVGDALRDRDAPRLRQAAHKFCPLLFAFSTVAGNVASDLEDHAAQDQLEEARPLVARLEAMTQDLMRLAGGLSLETLRQQARRTDQS